MTVPVGERGEGGLFCGRPIGVVHLRWHVLGWGGGQ